RGIGVISALLQVQDRRLERGHRFRPFDAGLVMTGLDDGTNQTRDADAIGAAMDRRLGAVRTRDRGLHRIRILGAEVEDLAYLDAPGMQPLLGGYLAVETRGVVDVFGRGID